MAFYGLPGELCASWADDYLSCRPRNYFVATGRDLLRHVTVNHTGELRLFGFLTKRRERRESRFPTLHPKSDVRRVNQSKVYYSRFVLVNINRFNKRGSSLITDFVYNRRSRRFARFLSLESDFLANKKRSLY